MSAWAQGSSSPDANYPDAASGVLYAPPSNPSNTTLNRSKTSAATLKATSSTSAAAAMNAKSSAVGVENDVNTVNTSLQLTRSTSLYDFQDGSRKNGMDYELNSAFQITKNYSIAVDTSYSQDLHDSQTSDFGDTSVSVSRRAMPLGRYVQMGHSIVIIAPTSKQSHTLNNLLMAARVGTGFAMNPAINPALELGISFLVGQNFNAYETAQNGDVLTKYSFSQSLSAGYSLKRFSLTGIFRHQDGWTYQGNVKESFRHVEELGYAISKNFAAALGHTNSGSVLRANGTDSNLALVNENDSMVYAALTIVF